MTFLYTDVDDATQPATLPDQKLVFFHVRWCAYSRTLMHIWDRLSERYGKFMQKVDCDANWQLVGRYNIEGFPTISLFIDDKISRVVIKGLDYEKNVETLESLLASF